MYELCTKARATRLTDRPTDRQTGRIGSSWRVRTHTHKRIHVQWDVCFVDSVVLTIYSQFICTLQPSAERRRQRRTHTHKTHEAISNLDRVALIEVNFVLEKIASSHRVVSRRHCHVTLAICKCKRSMESGGRKKE